MKVTVRRRGRCVLYAALVDALHTLIVPGLRELGMATGPIEAWLDSGASTDEPPTAFL